MAITILSAEDARTRNKEFFASNETAIRNLLFKINETIYRVSGEGNTATQLPDMSQWNATVSDAVKHTLIEAGYDLSLDRISWKKY